MVTTTRYSVIFQKFPSRVRVAQKITSSIRVAGTRWGLLFPAPIADGVMVQFVVVCLPFTCLHCIELLDQ